MKIPSGRPQSLHLFLLTSVFFVCLLQHHFGRHINALNAKNDKSKQRFTAEKSARPALTATTDAAAAVANRTKQQTLITGTTQINK